MKKERDFFSQYQMSGFNTQSFQPQMPFMNQDIETRLNKLENDLNNLNSRLSNLENILQTKATENFNNISSMYML